MGGMAACLAIRQEEDMGRLARRPVLLLLDREADEFLARHSSADDWLLKPIDPDAPGQDRAAGPGRHDRARLGQPVSTPETASQQWVLFRCARHGVPGTLPPG